MQSSTPKAHTFLTVEEGQARSEVARGLGFALASTSDPQGSSMLLSAQHLFVSYGVLGIGVILFLETGLLLGVILRVRR